MSKKAIFANRTQTQPQGWVVVDTSTTQQEADRKNYRFSRRSEAARAAAEDNFQSQPQYEYYSPSRPCGAWPERTLPLGDTERNQRPRKRRKGDMTREQRAQSFERSAEENLVLAQEDSARRDWYLAEAASDLREAAELRERDASAE